MKEKVKLLEAVVQKMFLNVIKLEAEVNELKNKIKKISLKNQFLLVNTLMTITSKTQNPKAVKKEQ